MAPMFICILLVSNTKEIERITRGTLIYHSIFFFSQLIFESNFNLNKNYLIYIINPV